MFPVIPDKIRVKTIVCRTAATRMGRAYLSKSGIAPLEPGIPVPFSQGITSGAIIHAHFFCSNVLRGPKSENNLHRVRTIYGIYKNNFVKKQILRQNLKLSTRSLQKKGGEFR